MKKITGPKMPKTDGTATHTRLKRPSHSAAPSAFPTSPMAFPTPDAAGGPGGPPPDQSMAPSPGGAPAGMPAGGMGDMGS